jgi:hypothetical protein
MSTYNIHCEEGIDVAVEVVVSEAVCGNIEAVAFAVPHTDKRKFVGFGF